MINPSRIAFTVVLLMSFVVGADAQLVPAGQQIGKIKLADVEMRDVCILADERTKTYYAVSSTFVPTTEARARPAVRAYTSKDLISWEGPHIIFQTPPDFWGGVNIRGIWAPELHAYKGKYYLFATFDTDSLFPEAVAQLVASGQARHAGAGQQFTARPLQTFSESLDLAG